LLCPESRTNALHRAALKSPRARHTALTTLFTGRPARGIVNRIMRELGPLPADVPDFPLAGNAIGALRAKTEALDLDHCTPLWAGQNVSGCRETPAAELTRELASGWRD
ncbi:MAG TPA: nitronate monooxygenase, partial [Pseudomonas nitrititolerans]|nr:nitronate monooxygenase [Stutzerimonas nitrititolerans]